MKNIHQLIARPKWFKNDKDVQLEDVVLFTLKESKGKPFWKLGIVVAMDKTQRPHVATIEYRNATEPGNANKKAVHEGCEAAHIGCKANLRQTTRSVREISVIHTVADLDYNTAEHRDSLRVNAHVLARIYQKSIPLQEFYCTSDDAEHVWDRVSHVNLLL